MTRHFSWIVCVLFLASPALAAKGPEIDLVDNKLSINAEAVSLGRLLQLIDMATGMKSKVPSELANRNISVRFSGLNVSEGVRKVFQGLPLDYVVIEGQGVIVTAASQALSGTEPVPTYNAPPQQPGEQQPFIQDFPQPFQGQPGNPQQPATIQTPFGALPNPRAQQPQPQQPQPNGPLPVTGQQNTLFPQTPQPNQPIGQPQQQQPVLPGMQPANPTPFGTPSPFGTAPFGTPNPATNNPNSLFNSSGTLPR
jgi:hypothetical protein